MRKAILFLVTTFLFSGCATVSMPTSNPQGRTLIESNPPGARIEINSQYVGTTPLRVDIPRASNIYGEPRQTVLIVAYPISEGQQTQKKLIAYDDPTPTHMFFEMNLVSVPSTSNLNLNVSSPQQSGASREPTLEEYKAALAKARADGNKKFEGEILQYAKEHGIKVE